MVTCSDSVSRGSVLDKSGDVIEERLRKHRLSVFARQAIADEREGIHATAKRLIDEGYQLILFTGGTGLSPRYVTPYAIRPLIEREVPGIMEVARDEMKKEGERLSVLRDRLLDSLLALPGTSLNGAREHLLPHAFNISFGSVESQVLISRLNKYLAVSSGSACTSATLEPSYVLRALGIGDKRAAGSLRFSLGRPTKEDEIINDNSNTTRGY